MKNTTTNPTVSQVLAAFATLMTRTSFDGLDLQPLINAGNAGVLGPAFRQWIKLKGWRHFKYVFQIQIQWDVALLIKTPDEIFDQLGLAGKTSMVRQMFDVAKDIGLFQFDLGCVRVYSADTIGMADWQLSDVYGEKGQKYLDYLGLEFCHVSDALWLSDHLRCDGLKTYVLHPSLCNHGLFIEGHVPSCGSMTNMLSACGLTTTNTLWYMNRIAVRVKEES